jgi:hypothetical protein
LSDSEHRTIEISFGLHCAGSILKHWLDMIGKPRGNDALCPCSNSDSRPGPVRLALSGRAPRSSVNPTFFASAAAINGDLRL